MQISEVTAGYNACSGEESRGLIGQWCANVPGYLANEHLDTYYLYNPYVQVGINRSFGATTFQLFGQDPATSLIYEHGGGAMQLSLYGTGFNGENNTPGQACNSTADNAPFNPIMAQADNCQWDSPNNDIPYSGFALGSTYIHMERSNPYQYTKTMAFSGLFWAQAAHLDAGNPYVRYDYHVNYSGTLNLQNAPQEMPALHTALNINAAFYYADANHNIATSTLPSTCTFPSAYTLVTTIPGRTNYADRSACPTDTNSEAWASACDSSATHCVTVACFDLNCKEMVLARGAAGYVTPTGYFSIVPGLDMYFSVYVFPYRYDAVVAGKSVRQWIRDMSGM